MIAERPKRPRRPLILLCGGIAVWSCGLLIDSAAAAPLLLEAGGMAIVALGTVDLAVTRARRKGVRPDEMDWLAVLSLVIAVATALGALGLAIGPSGFAPVARLSLGAAAAVIGNFIVPLCLRLSLSKTEGLKHA